MLGRIDKKEPPFRVPEDYFRDLNAKIMSALPNDEASVLFTQKKENPFDVPQDYFAGFAARIMNVLPEKETHTLETSKKSLPFKAPENYFRDFNAQLMEALPPKDLKLQKKVKPIWKKITPWAAVAAVFMGILFTTGFLDIQPSAIGTIDPVESTVSIYDEAEDFYLFLSDEVTASAIYNESFYSE